MYDEKKREVKRKTREKQKMADDRLGLRLREIFKENLSI